VIGRTIRFNDEPYTIIGVLPPTLRMVPDGLVSVVMPLTDPPPYDRLLAIARLQPGLPVEAAQARLDDVSAVLERERPREVGWGIAIRPVERFMNPRTRLGLTVLSGAVTFLLLIACANAAGLLFIRGVARQPELALRMALGGSRGALFRHVITENALLALLAGVLGALIAWWGARALVALAPPNLIAFNYNTVEINARVLVFALLLTVLTGLLFGMLPAVRAARTNPARAGRSATATPSQVRARNMVQVVQLSLVVILLTGAGLLGRSFQQLMAVDPGFDAERLLLLSYFTPQTRRVQEGGVAAFNRELDERLRALPGVTGVSWSGGAGFRTDYTITLDDGTTMASGSGLLPHASVDTAYFRVMGIPILEGRAFTIEDVRTDAGSVILDRDFAGALFPGRSAVGRRFRIREEPWVTVVGVSGDIKLEGPDDPLGEHFMFYPIEAARIGAANVAIRTNSDPAVLAHSVRTAVWDIDPGQPIWKLLTGRQTIAEAVVQPRFVLIITMVFAAVALLLASVGVYGLISFTVAQRTREIGVRMALGARVQRVMGEIVGSGMRLALIGAVIGLAGAVALSRLITGLLFGVSPLDATALALATAVLLSCCVVALLGPARRAARIDPASSVRAE
ncbi:MAG: ABC transporter permease, partial [Gemmatimonadetes bacterium]|nr:ABC transporter permease [Gemmatimonadota bacterium]